MWAIMDYTGGEYGIIDGLTYKIIYNFLIFIEVIGCSGDLFIAFKYLKSALALLKPDLVRTCEIFEWSMLGVFYTG